MSDGRRGFMKKVFGGGSLIAAGAVMPITAVGIPVTVGGIPVIRYQRCTFLGDVKDGELVSPIAAGKNGHLPVVCAWREPMKIVGASVKAQKSGSMGLIREANPNPRTEAETRQKEDERQLYFKTDVLSRFMGKKKPVERPPYVKGQEKWRPKPY